MLKIDDPGPDRVGLACHERTDGESLKRLFFRLSPETIRRRFLAPLSRPEQASPDRLLDLDHHHREAVAAIVNGEIVGVARYARESGAGSAELAVVVADQWQRQGIGSTMIAGLVKLAANAGIPAFTVTIEADNRAMLRLLTRFWRPDNASISHGLYEATLPINTTA